MSKEQGRLFEDLPLPEDLTHIVKIAGSTKQLDPAQRTFNRLTDQVRKKRETVAHWKAQFDHLHRRTHSEMMPVLEEMQSAQTDLIKHLDALLSKPSGGRRLSQKRREALTEYLLWLLKPLLAETDDPELKAIRERHSVLTAEEDAELEREMTRAILGDMFGEEVLEGLEGDNLEDMLANAKKRLDEKQAAQQESGRARRPNRKARELAEAQQEADRAVRETYRKLASQLHPDRVMDEEERQRKTALMQRANEAYAKNDLLTLLTLQLECEQLDADRLAELPEARIQRFNHALRGQIRALDAEKQEIIDHIAAGLYTQSHFIARVGPDALDAIFNKRLDDARAECEAIKQRATALADPSRQSQAIDAIVTELRAFEKEMGFDELVTAMFMDEDTPSTSRPGGSGNHRKKKKRR